MTTLSSVHHAGRKRVWFRCSSYSCCPDTEHYSDDNKLFRCLDSLCARNISMFGMPPTLLKKPQLWHSFTFQPRFRRVLSVPGRCTKLSTRSFNSLQSSTSPCHPNLRSLTRTSSFWSTRRTKICSIIHERTEWAGKSPY